MSLTSPIGLWQKSVCVAVHRFFKTLHLQNIAEVPCSNTIVAILRWCFWISGCLPYGFLASTDPPELNNLLECCIWVVPSWHLTVGSQDSTVTMDRLCYMHVPYPFEKNITKKAWNNHHHIKPRKGWCLNPQTWKFIAKPGGWCPTTTKRCTKSSKKCQFWQLTNLIKSAPMNFIAAK